jgi:NADH dehydrogenase/NADH:ubiquinone oxidoreductase subunit G
MLESSFMLPISSMYEQNGYVYNFEGVLRRFNKVLTTSKTLISMKLMFLTLIRLNKEFN